MATIVILEHEFQDRLGIPYMAHAFAESWRRRGHRVLYHRARTAPPPGDVALLHHDLTVVPDSYLALARGYRRVVNLATRDISKSRYSACRLMRGDPWEGQVFVKTDANHGGHVDDALHRMALSAGLASDIRPGPVMADYYLCESIGKVPEPLWDTPGVIVEKFIPERDERGLYLRMWTFFGDRDRSSRYRSHSPLIKAENVLDREDVPVPDEMRALRASLGFDFGKFDYVLHEGRYVLLDANRTPGAPTDLVKNFQLAAVFDELARGIDVFL